MVACFQRIKTEYLALSLERQQRVVCALLTDGAHTGSVTMEETMQDDFFKTCFQSIIGIGTKKNVDDAVLSLLANDRPDAYSLACTEHDVANTINGSYFDLLMATYTDATITVYVAANEKVVVLPSVKKKMLTESQWASIQEVNAGLEASTVVHLTHHNGTFLVEGRTNPLTVTDKSSVAPREFWLAIDASGSMSDIVRPPEQAEFPSEAVEVAVDESDPFVYVAMTMEAATLSEHTHVLGGGNVVDAVVTYTHPVTKKRETHRISLTDVALTDTMDMAAFLVNMTTMLGRKMSKDEVHAFYRSNLNFLLRLEEIPEWIKAQGKALWNNLKLRYKSTLERGDQFFHQTPMALGLLMRATSSSAASQSAQPQHVVHTEHDGMICKLCFDNPITVLFPDCRHAGVCKECYTMHLNQQGKQECPFCRKAVTAWSEIRIEEGDDCQTTGCLKAPCYVGDCGHLVCCKSCKSDLIKGVVPCHLCKKEVSVVRIYVC